MYGMQGMILSRTMLTDSSCCPFLLRPIGFHSASGSCSRYGRGKHKGDHERSISQPDGRLSSTGEKHQHMFQFRIHRSTDTIRTESPAN